MHAIGVSRCGDDFITCDVTIITNGCLFYFLYHEARDTVGYMETKYLLSTFISDSGSPHTAEQWQICKMFFSIRSHFFCGQY